MLAGIMYLSLYSAKCESRDCLQALPSCEEENRRLINFRRFFSIYFAVIRKKCTFVGSFSNERCTEGWVSGLNQQFAKLPIS